jgi:hypothetical protein
MERRSCALPWEVCNSASWLPVLRSIGMRLQKSAEAILAGLTTIAKG